jgi:hypothetical protein
MGKLLERLKDPARSGVYRASRSDEIVDALRGSELAIARIDLKRSVLDAFSQALGFPDWFGENWDALEDCLTDLSWREAAGHVLVLEGGQALPGDEVGILIDVLTAAAEFWAGQGKPFFAVFVDPKRVLELSDLFREA